MKSEVSKFKIVVELIGLVFFIYIFVSILGFKSDNSNNLILSGMYLVELGIHEISHLFTMFLPPLLTALAGSVGEIGFTLTLLIESLRKKSYFAASFACQWVMLAMYSVGRYIADARSQLIPLIGFSDNPTHDWQYILSRFNLLEYDKTLGGVSYTIGTIIGIVGLALAVIIIVRQLTNFPPQNEKEI